MTRTKGYLELLDMHQSETCPCEPIIGENEHIFDALLKLCWLSLHILVYSISLLVLPSDVGPRRALLGR